MALTYAPTAAMSAAARRGLQMRMASPRSRQGGTRIGVALLDCHGPGAY